MSIVICLGASGEGGVFALHLRILWNSLHRRQDAVSRLEMGVEKGRFRRSGSGEQLSD